MQIHYRLDNEIPNLVAWVQCEPEQLDEVRQMFPVENYEILVGIKSNYDPLTCDTYTLNNPPAPTWGVDVWKRETDGRCEGLSPE
jgi:hypothetical protein